MKSLKTFLLADSAAALIAGGLAIWLILSGKTGAAVFDIAVTLILIIVLVVWFILTVEKPLEHLEEFSAKITDGSFGIRQETDRADEIGRLTGEINRMSEQMSKNEKAGTEFISRVSHELRTPLTAITGWAETIAYDEAIQGDSLRGIQIISREAERLTNLVAELLEFTRMQDGRFALRIDKIDIAAELEDAIFTYGELMRQSGMEVNYFGPDEDIPPIPGDSERLKQVFLNLLDNALNHAHDGKKVDVTCRAGNTRVEIIVRDYGPGIPEAELPHVKEKFYKGSSRNRGTGIGLAICDEIVTRHGGELTIENAPDHGCIVSVFLPMKV